jgi:amino acid transporter
VSELAVWGVNFPGGISIDNIKWRAFVWAVSEAMLLLSIAINYLPPRLYKGVFRFSLFIIMLDFLLCLIWLPIAVHNTYGFRSAKDVFTLRCAYRCIYFTDRSMLTSRYEKTTELAPLRDGIGFYRCELAL